MLSIERLRPRHGATVLFLLAALIGMLWSKTPMLDPPVAIAAPLPYESVTTAPDERPPEQQDVHLASNSSSSSVDTLVAIGATVVPEVPNFAFDTYRPGASDHHGSGNAVDFSNGTGNTDEQYRLATWFADNCAGDILELIYQDPRFDRNIKNGSFVGNGIGYYGSGIMAQHQHHVHVAMTADGAANCAARAGYQGMPPSAPAADTPAPTPSDAAPAPVSGEPDWHRLMMCESGAHGQWRANTGNGYHGGLQFDPDTWNLFGGQEYAVTADQATDVEQIAIGEKVLAAQGPGAWPKCSYEKIPGWWNGGGSSASAASTPAPVPSAPVATTPVQVEPQALPAAPTQAPAPAPTQSWVDLALDPPVATETPTPAHEAPAAPAAPVWVEEVVEQLPEPIQAPVQDWVEQQAPVYEAPAPVYEAPAAPAAPVWVEEFVTQLPEPVQAPAQNWIEQQIPAYEPPAPVYQAPAPVAPAIPAPVLDHVQSFVQNTPALSGNLAITGALASLGVG